jgi:hypothetical protein
LAAQGTIFVKKKNSCKDLTIILFFFFLYPTLLAHCQAAQLNEKWQIEVDEKKAN